MVGRLGVSRGGVQFGEIAGNIVATKSIGPTEWDDFSQPLWGVTADTSLSFFPIGAFYSCSIVSDFDLALSRIHVFPFKRVTGVPSNTNITLGVPLQSYNLFEFPGFSFRAGLRPSVKRFDAFNTLVATSGVSVSNSASAEMVICNPAIDNDTFITIGSFPIVQSRRQITGCEILFDPPMILPGGLFLTVQPGFDDTEIRTTFVYRELPTSLPFGDRP